MPPRSREPGLRAFLRHRQRGGMEYYGRSQPGSRSDNGEARPTNVPGLRGTQSAPSGADVKTKPSGSPAGRVLTPTPRWRLPAPARESRKPPTNSGLGDLTAPPLQE